MSRKHTLFFLIDLGGYFGIVSKKDAQKYICKTGLYNCRKVDTVRIPNHCLYKKEINSKFRETIGEDNFMKIASFDARYIQNVQYRKYRNKDGFIKVECYKNGKLGAIKYYISTGEVKDDFEAHGIKYSKEYFQMLVRGNKSIIREGLEYKFSRVAKIEDSSSLPDSTEVTTCGCSPNHYILIYNNNIIYNNYSNKNLMIRRNNAKIESKVNVGVEYYKEELE